MSPVAVGAEEKRVTRCWSGFGPPKGDETRGRGWQMKPGNPGWWLGRETGGQSESGGARIERGRKTRKREGGGCDRVGGSFWKRGGWPAEGFGGREGAGTRILSEHRAILGPL